MQKPQVTIDLMKSEKIKLVPYHNLLLWDVKRYLGNSLKIEHDYVTLKEILTPFKQKISHAEVVANKYQIISKINFSGDLFLREISEIETYKGQLYLVPKNALIFSKINARHGCIYFNEDGKPFVVSNEYPVFLVNLKKVNGEYLKQYLRSSKLKEHLKSRTTGISKARIKSAEFLSVPFPQKPLDVQLSIINQYSHNLLRSQEQLTIIKNLQNKFQTFFNSALGIKIVEVTKRKGISYTRFLLLEKWGYDFAFAVRKLSGKYPTMKIADICLVGSGGTPHRSNKEYYNGSIPWIKTGEVINDVIFDTEEKISETALKESAAKLFPKGSLIIAMYGQGATRGRTAKLGIDASTNQACAVLYNINNDIILTDFLWVYLINEYENLRAMASGNNQPNLNQGMISNFPIQIPPLNVQREIVEKYLENRQEQRKAEELAYAFNKEATSSFEEAIFNN
jgi:type I restriction enzyme, S subunit